MLYYFTYISRSFSTSADLHNSENLNLKYIHCKCMSGSTADTSYVSRLQMILGGGVKEVSLQQYPNDAMLLKSSMNWQLKWKVSICMNRVYFTGTVLAVLNWCLMNILLLCFRHECWGLSPHFIWWRRQLKRCRKLGKDDTHLNCIIYRFNSSKYSKYITKLMYVFKIMRITCIHIRDVFLWFWKMKFHYTYLKMRL